MNSEQLVKYALVLVTSGLLVYFIYDYSCRSQKKGSEHFYEDGVAKEGGKQEVAPSESAPQDLYRAVPPSETKQGDAADCFPKDRLTAEDLLPRDAANSKWAQVNPAGQGDVKDKNFLNAGFHVGVNTVGSSLRNANRQLRSDPPNPQLQVSPWNQTTIEPDLSRRPLEVGGCSQ